VIVVDANVIIYLQIPGEQTEQAVSAYRKDPNWIAPRLWRSEFRNALALYMRRGILTLAKALEAMQRAEDAMQGRDFDVVPASVLKLAADSGCSAYDCEYVSLAQDLDVPLITSDKAILRKFKSIAMSMQAFCK
jgi:predicted nucleic acid-binding protein